MGPKTPRGTNKNPNRVPNEGLAKSVSGLARSALARTRQILLTLKTFTEILVLLKITSY
jgi:hypothetical protein